MPDTTKEVDLKKIAQELVNLKVIEVNKLLTILKEEHGIEPATTAPVVVAGNSAKNDEKKEKTSFNVVLKSVGVAKLKVIKALKEITGLDLKQSKELADKLSTVKENVKKEEAENIKSQLEEAGAEVVLE